jgi:hypothetical protein
VVVETVTAGGTVPVDRLLLLEFALLIWKQAKPITAATVTATRLIVIDFVLEGGVVE